MNFPGYYQVFDNSHISYVESHVFVDANQSNGYKWYQSCPSSDGMTTSPLHYSVKYRPPEPPPLSSHGNSPYLAEMNLVASTPCYPTAQYLFPQNQVSNPSLYYSREYEPPPTDTSKSYTSDLCAYKMFDTSSEREYVFADENFDTTGTMTSPYTLTCHTTLSTGQLYYALESTSPLTTPCSTVASSTALISVLGNHEGGAEFTNINEVVDNVSVLVESNGNGLVETVVVDEDNLQMVVLRSGRAVVGTVSGNGQIDDRKLVKKAVKVQGELMVDAVEIAPQMFDEILVRNSNSLEEKVSGDALDITTQGPDKFIQMTDGILLQMEEIKHLLLAMSPSSKRGEVTTTHKADPTPVDEDPLAIQATEVEPQALVVDESAYETDREMYEPWNRAWDWYDDMEGDDITEVKGVVNDDADIELFASAESDEVDKEVNASKLQGAVPGITCLREDVFEIGSSLQKLAEIDTTKLIDSIMIKSDERLVNDKLFIDNSGVAIDSDLLVIATVGNKEGRGENGKEGEVAVEEGVLVHVGSTEKSFTTQCALDELCDDCLRNSELTIWESHLIMHYYTKAPGGTPAFHIAPEGLVRYLRVPNTCPRIFVLVGQAPALVKQATGHHQQKVDDVDVIIVLPRMLWRPGISFHNQTEAGQHLRMTELAANTNIMEQISEPPKSCNQFEWLVSPNFILKDKADRKVADGQLNFVLYQQHVLGYNVFQLCYVLILPHQLMVPVVQKMACGWYWSVITLIFDPGGCDCYNIFFQCYTSLRTRMFLRGMDCNGLGLYTGLVLLLQLGHLPVTSCKPKSVKESIMAIYIRLCNKDGGGNMTNFICTVFL